MGWLTQAEVAARLGCCVGTVKQMRFRDGLRYLPGRPVMIDEADLENFLTDMQTEKAAQAVERKAEARSEGRGRPSSQRPNPNQAIVGAEPVRQPTGPEIANSTRWTGKSQERKMHDIKYLPTLGVAIRFGKCKKTIARWVTDPMLGFPQPLVINRRWFFEIEKLKAWEAAQSAKSETTALAVSDQQQTL